MREEFTFTSIDGIIIHVYKWPAENPKAVVHIAHGAVEHALRFEDLADKLNKEGFSVYAEDHRGHGKTAGSPEKVGHFSDKNGAFRMVVEDMHTLTQRIKQENPGLPVFMLGHSMGSFLVRIYAAKYGGGLKGVILTGTGGESAAYLTFMIWMSRLIMVFRGTDYRSPSLNKKYVDTLNGPFGGETGSEFICSDPAVVDKYNKDEYCGNSRSAEFFHEMLWGTREAASKRVINGYPKDLPLYIGSGEFDSVGGKELDMVKRDVAAYQKAGVADLFFKVYPGMRHEILNEKDKQTVYSDIIGWLNKKL